MDANKLVEVLRATLDPNQREEAEKQLEIVSSLSTLLMVQEFHGCHEIPETRVRTVIWFCDSEDTCHLK